MTPAPACGKVVARGRADGVGQSRPTTEAQETRAVTSQNHTPTDAQDAVNRLLALADWAEAQGDFATAHNLRECAGEVAPCDDE